jgi:hypothetical protein
MVLESTVGKKKGHRYDYLTQIGYDKFEDRVYISYGNGTETAYEYETERRRLQHIKATTSAGRKMMDNIYAYDLVNNITQLKSVAPIPESNLKGGNFVYEFKYDDLYRLTKANGHYQGATHEHTYTLDMNYTATGSILNKTRCTSVGVTMKRNGDPGTRLPTTWNTSMRKNNPMLQAGLEKINIRTMPMVTKPIGRAQKITSAVTFSGMRKTGYGPSQITA